MKYQILYKKPFRYLVLKKNSLIEKGLDGNGMWWRTDGACASEIKTFRTLWGAKRALKRAIPEAKVVYEEEA